MYLSLVVVVFDVMLCTACCCACGNRKILDKVCSRVGGGKGARGIVDECTNGGGGGRGGGVRRRRKGGEGGYLVSDRVCVVRKRFYIFL